MADQPTSNPPATPSPQKDVVDPQWIEAVFTSLGAMQVELDADPLALGPKRLNGKIAQCRTLLSQCQTIFLDVSQYLGLYRRELRRATADFKLKMKELLSTDPEVILDMGDFAHVEGRPMEPLSKLMEIWGKYPRLRAVKYRQVRQVDSEIFIRPGPRMGQAAEQLSLMLQGKPAR